MPQPGESCRITNVGDKPWSDSYANHKYAAGAGQEVIASFEAVCLWFGHPDAVDLGDGKNFRTDELTRLRVRYGVLDVAVEDPNSGHVNKSPEPCHPFNQDQQWDYNKPVVEVHDIMGTKVTTVVDDPYGASITPAATTIGQQELLVEQMRRMQEQMQSLQAQLDSARRADQSEADSGTINTDVPDPEPTSSPTPPHAATATPSMPIPSAPPEEVTEDTPTRIRVGNKA